MKLPLFSLFPSLSLVLCLTLMPNVRANAIANQQNQQISVQEIATRKEIRTLLGSVGRAQQAHFLENHRFATQIKQLGLGDDIQNSIPGYQWQVFTDKKAEIAAITVLSPKQSGSRTYVNFVNLAISSAGEKITITTLCESKQNQRIIPKVPTKILKNQDTMKCPSGFRKFELSQDEEKIYEQVKKEKELVSVVGIFNSLQKQYYSQNQVFADRNEELLGFDINKIQPQLKSSFKLLPIQDTKQGIITIATFPNQNYKSYLGIVKTTEKTSGKVESLICEVPQQESIDLQKLKKLSLNILLNCPPGSKEVSLSSEEIAYVNEGKEKLQNYKAEIAEIKQPKKTPFLKAADKLAQEGKYLEALEKYYLASGALGINEYDILLEFSGESTFNPTRDALFKKIELVLQAAKPLIEQQKKEIQSEMYSVFDRFPNEKNHTGQKIKEIAASQLGFNILTTPQQELKIPANKSEEFSEIAESLREYFNDKSKKPNQKLSDNLRKYTNKNRRAIATIRDLLLNGEIPRWGTDYKWVKEGDFAASAPSYLNIVNLQRLLAIDILDQQQQGNNPEMLKSLEASWRLSESLQNDPSLLGQLVNIIIRRSQIQVMEKLDNLPVVWQQRLLAYDYTKSMIQALKVEAFSQLQGLDKIITPEKDTAIAKLYRNWYGVNTYKLNQAFYAEVERQQNNLCSVDIKALEKQYFNSESSISPSYVNQILKAQHLMLESEMMQKVLQIKAEIAQGKTVPNYLLNIPSSICSTNKWVYKSFPNAKWSISLDKQPTWQSRIARSPLTYTGDRP
ncbi:pentapeptide repeat protein [Calothrix sp. NIES-4101]|nr:pentapeptide repeat protein [Calothrix sp. NIES-4101]